MAGVVVHTFNPNTYCVILVSCPFSFETGTYCVNYAWGEQVVILLPLPPKGLGYRHAPCFPLSLATAVS